MVLDLHRRALSALCQPDPSSGTPCHATCGCGDSSSTTLTCMDGSCGAPTASVRKGAAMAGGTHAMRCMLFFTWLMRPLTLRLRLRSAVCLPQTRPQPCYWFARTYLL